MATKDYVYLGLIAFSAIVFYLHGWYAGAQERAKRKPRALEPTLRPEVSVFVTTVDAITAEGGRLAGTVQCRSRVADTPVHCFFGNN